MTRGAVNTSLIFLLPDLLLSRQAAPWIVRGGGHFALIAGGCLSLVPAGQASDRWNARGLLVFANLTTALALGLLLLRDSVSWDKTTQQEFLRNIDEKTDELRELIDNTRKEGR